MTLNTVAQAPVRIQLSERGWPIVGTSVYARASRAGCSSARFGSRSTPERGSAPRLNRCDASLKQCAAGHRQYDIWPFLGNTIVANSAEVGVKAWTGKFACGKCGRATSEAGDRRQAGKCKCGNIMAAPAGTRRRTAGGRPDSLYELAAEEKKATKRQHEEPVGFPRPACRQ